jgi:hypothetical protein
MKRTTLILLAIAFAATHGAATLFAQTGPRDPLLDGPSIFSADRQLSSRTQRGTGIDTGYTSRTRPILSFVGVTRDDKNVMTAFIQVGSNIVQVREGNPIPGDDRVILGISFQSLRISSGGVVQELPIREMGVAPAEPVRTPRIAPGTPLNVRPPAMRRPARGRDAVPL